MSRKMLLVALISALATAALFTQLSSRAPDGLESTARRQGFASKENPLHPAAPLAGYEWTGLSNKRLSSALAGVAGVLLVFGTVYGVAKLMRRR